MDILEGLPLEITVKVLPVDGGVALLPVVQYIYVDVEFNILHVIPSILTTIGTPKLLPLICRVSPPVDGPNCGYTDDTTEVDECW